MKRIPSIDVLLERLAEVQTVDGLIRVETTLMSEIKCYENVLSKQDREYYVNIWKCVRESFYEDRLNGSPDRETVG